MCWPNKYKKIAKFCNMRSAELKIIFHEDSILEYFSASSAVCYHSDVRGKSDIANISKNETWQVSV